MIWRQFSTYRDPNRSRSIRHHAAVSYATLARGFVSSASDGADIMVPPVKGLVRRASGWRVDGGLLKLCMLE